MAIFDDIDLDILKNLLRSSGTPKSEVAQRLGIAASAVSARMKRLIDRGVVRRYELRLEPKAFGYNVLAYVFVTEAKPLSGPPAGEQLARISCLEELHKIAGEDCYLLKVRARDNNHLAEILENEINPIQSISGVRTTIVLRAIKEDVALGGVAEFWDSPP